MVFFKKKKKTIEPKRRPSLIQRGIEENKINMKMMSASIREIQAPVADLIGLQSVIADIPAESTIYHYAKSMNACGVLLASMIENMKFYYLLCSDLYDVDIFPFVLRAELMTTWNKVIGETNLYSNFNDDIISNTGEVTCSIDIEKNVPTGLVKTDSFGLMKIFQCILSNAIKFTLEGRVDVKIYISGDDEDTILNIVVSDTGIGIPKDVQGAIFNPLTKAHSESIQGGVGMGLPVSKEMAKIMNGDVVLVESSENKGSVFHITIPVKFSKVNHEINRSFHSDSVLDLRKSDKKGSSVILDLELDEGPMEMPMVLLAEDIKLNRIIVTKMLGDVNVIIKTAENGIDAIEECQKHKFDIILMDIIMPKIGGLEATLEIRKNCPLNKTTPIIALTGILAGKIKTECLKSGMVDCLQKPVMRKNLIETVATYTEPRHRRWIVENSHMD